MSERAKAPGKLILSGEHAVVHGRPALVLAVNRYAEATATRTGDGHLHVSLPSFSPDYRLPMDQLAAVQTRLRDNYQRFLDGHIAIRDVMDQPFQLIAFALASLLERSGVAAPPDMRIDMTTDIPVGCGMGSSAAVILAALGAMSGLLGDSPNPPRPTGTPPRRGEVTTSPPSEGGSGNRTLGLGLAKDDIFQLAWDAEKLQHGQPSGVDPWICCHGGCARFQRGQAEPVSIPGAAMHLIHTGIPEATTGECVMEVSRRFKDHPIWDRFEQVTREVEAALVRNDHDALHAAIRVNHRLLCEIGVVPERVEAFIGEIEEAGGCAKICGAGSIRGDRGGIALIFTDEAPAGLCDTYGYSCITVMPDHDGLTAA